MHKIGDLIEPQPGQAPAIPGGTVVIGGQPHAVVIEDSPQGPAPMQVPEGEGEVTIASAITAADSIDDDSGGPPSPLLRSIAGEEENEDEGLVTGLKIATGRDAVGPRERLIPEGSHAGVAPLPASSSSRPVPLKGRVTASATLPSNRQGARDAITLSTMSLGTAAGVAGGVVIGVLVGASAGAIAGPIGALVGAVVGLVIGVVIHRSALGSPDVEGQASRAIRSLKSRNLLTDDDIEQWNQLSPQQMRDLLYVPNSVIGDPNERQIVREAAVLCAAKHGWAAASAKFKLGFDQDELCGLITVSTHEVPKAPVRRAIQKAVMLRAAEQGVEAATELKRQLVDLTYIDDLGDKTLEQSIRTSIVHIATGKDGLEAARKVKKALIEPAAAGKIKAFNPHVFLRLRRDFLPAYQDATKDLGILKAPEGDVTRRLAELASLGVAFQRVSREVLGSAEVRHELRQLDEMAASGDYKGHPGQLMSVMTDMLIFASLVGRRGTGDKQQSIDVISHNDLVRRLRELGEAKSFSSTKRLSRLGHRDYVGAPAAQRMLAVSMTNLEPNLREELEDDPTFKKIEQRPDLVHWMLAASGPQRQEYLNTCAAAAMNLDVLARCTSIAGLHKIAMSVAGEIDDALNNEDNKDFLDREAWKGGPSVREVMSQRLQKSRNELNALKADIDKLADSGPVPGAKLDELTSRWNKTMQRLLTMADSATWRDEQQVAQDRGWKHDPRFVLVTKKPLINQWDLSAVTMQFTWLRHPRFDERMRRGPASTAAGAKVIGHAVDTGSLEQGSRLYPVPFKTRGYYRIDDKRLDSLSDRPNINKITKEKKLMSEPDFMKLCINLERAMKDKKFRSKMEFEAALTDVLQVVPADVVYDGKSTLRGFLFAFLSSGASVDREVDSFSALSPKERKKAINDLWQQVFRAGGAPLSTTFHALHIKAVNVDGRRMFLIQDPKHAAVHQLKSLDEMIDILNERKWMGQRLADYAGKKLRAELLIDTLDTDHRARLEALDDRINGEL